MFTDYCSATRDESSTGHPLVKLASSKLCISPARRSGGDSKQRICDQPRTGRAIYNRLPNTQASFPVNPGYSFRPVLDDQNTDTWDKEEPERMKVATFPESWRSNPFLDLLESHLAELGVEYEKVGSDYLSIRWIWQHRRRIEVLHFHWLQYHYLRSSRLASWTQLFKFFIKLIFAKICGYRIVWTAHNLQPHERQVRFLDTAGYFLMVVTATSVVTLCQKASYLIQKRYHRSRRIFTGYHGNYLDVYPNDLSQADAKERLGVSKCFPVFLFFGNLRMYKGLIELIDAFRQVENQQARLIIAGKANDPGQRQEIITRSKDDPRIVPALEWVAVDDVQVYFKASDYVTLPFTDVMTSGSALLALGFGRPVIAPALGCLPEIITSENGLLYNPEQPGGLVDALKLCEKMDAAQMGRQARQTAMRFGWKDLAQVTFQAYRAD